jgi:hypothetical protein
MDLKDLIPDNILNKIDLNKDLVIMTFIMRKYFKTLLDNLIKNNLEHIQTRLNIIIDRQINNQILFNNTNNNTNNHIIKITKNILKSFKNNLMIH